MKWQTKVKKSILILAVLILTAGIVKDYVVREALIRYMNKRVQGYCTIGGLRLGLRHLSIDKVAWSNRDFNITLDRGAVTYTFSHFLRPRISHVYGEGVDVKIKNFDEMCRAFVNTFATSSEEKERVEPKAIFLLNVHLSNIVIEVKNASWGEGRVHFSFAGRFRGGALEQIHNFDLFDGKVRFRDFRVANVKMHKSKGDEYTLVIPQVFIKEKEIGNISFPLKIENDCIELMRAPNVLFGQDAYVEAKAKRKGMDKYCLSLSLENVSFGKVVSLITEKDDILLDGVFDGNVMLCMKGRNISYVEGGFYDNRGGLINIKKEVPLQFLRKYLEKDAYKSVIDNLKSYAYNKGTISVSTKDSRLVAVLNFESEKMGKREFAVTFHNIIGGGQ